VCFINLPFKLNDDKNGGTVEFSSEIDISLNFTAEHTENAKAPESLNND
jgi:hypothetical protein